MEQKIELSYTHEESVARLLMTSPANLNAMDQPMAEAFCRAVLELKSRRLRAVVIRGAGRAFSAGGDLAMLKAKASQDFESNRLEMLDFYQSFLGLRKLEVPLICAVHGYAVGAGFCFAAACDIRLGDVTASFAAPFTRLGLHPGMGGSFFLPRTLGFAAANDLMLTGRRLSAAEALSLGFLSRVVEPGKLEKAIEEVVDGILMGGPEATAALIRSQRDYQQEELASALEREAFEQAASYARPEFLTGLEAVGCKRAPEWPSKSSVG